MFQWFQDHQENYVIDYLEDYISDFLLNEFHDEELLQKKLHMLDEKIVKFQKETIVAIRIPHITVWSIT